MAHECPACGKTCYCNGDIDDCFLDGSEEEEDCVCCDENPDEDDDWECCYPGQCCMPGPHMRSECHTAEDYKSLDEEARQ